MLLLPVAVALYPSVVLQVEIAATVDWGVVKACYILEGGGSSAFKCLKSKIDKVKVSVATENIPKLM